MIFFFFNDTATTEIYTLSLHDALPIFVAASVALTATPSAFGPEHVDRLRRSGLDDLAIADVIHAADDRSEEHTSELQSPCNLVCRLLLEKKNTDACRQMRPGP